SFIRSAGVSTAAVPGLTPLLSLRNQVLPVLTKSGCNSGACHGASAGKGGLKLTLRGYDPDTDYATLTRQALGRRIVKTEPGRSLILLKPTMQVPHGGGERFKTDSRAYRLLSHSLAAGTPPSRPPAAAPRELEVQPAAGTLAPGQPEWIRVRAHFSGGHTEDVTRWVKYGSSDAGVATVGDDGTVNVQGSGEAAITVW